MGGISFPRFDNLYDDYLNRTPMQEPDIGADLDPNDPDLTNLRNLYAKPSNASALYRDYLRRRPQYSRPGGGELFINSMIGVIQGKGDPRATAQIVNGLRDQKYERLYQQWADEGRYIDDVARLMEADKNREIKSVEFGIRQKSASRREQTRAEQFKAEEARRLAIAAATDDARRRADEDRDLARKGLESQRGILNELAKSRLEESRLSRADREKVKPTDQKSATEIVDQHIQRTMPELFEFADEYGKPLSKPVFIGNEVDATKVMAVRKNLIRKVLAGGVL